ncbi:hypothetical protein [Oscillibacter sp.]|uniref:DUF3298 and DUF4163 domain-containing protein n=1 Tax=Oscillibacter sp. TaxID=1945593 RepID=UPI0028AD18BC|nr:hypothetical protein [Oscillibacter sp.]
MRKQILSALGLSLALLAGCANAAPSGPTSAPADESFGAMGAASVLSSASETLDFVLESEKKSDTRVAEDGTTLAAYNYEIPVLRVMTEDGQIMDSAATAAQKAAVDVAAAFNSNFEDWLKSTDFSSVLDRAEEDYARRMESNADWFYEEDFTYTSWRTDRLISIGGAYYSFTGGAHPNSVFLGWNFDLQTGRFLHPTALGEDSEKFQAAVAEEIIRQADARAAENGFESPTDMYWEDYQGIAAQWPDYAVTFSDDGMMVVFSAYGMASYAAGEQAFVLDWDFLKPYLSEDGRLLLNISADTEAAAKTTP